MDFSSISRALESLDRRRPPLDDVVLEAARSLRNRQQPGRAEDDNNNQDSDDGDEAFLRSLRLLLSSSSASASEAAAAAADGSAVDEGGEKEGGDEIATAGVTASSTSTRERWEPLAVGLYIATETLLAQASTEGGQDAPAGPSDAATTTTTTAATATVTTTTAAATVYVDGPRVPSTTASTTAPQPLPLRQKQQPPDAFRLPLLSKERCLELCRAVHAVALENLEHNEPRIRTAVAKAVGAYCMASRKLERSLEEETTTSASPGEGSDDNDVPASSSSSWRSEIHRRLIASIREHIETGRGDAAAVAENHSKDSTGALDDTTGWRALETNWQCLAAMIRSLAGEYLTEFDPVRDPHLLSDCRYSAVTHPNRHVRAAAMLVLEQLVVAAASSTEDHNRLLTDRVSALRTTLKDVLKSGLADNWSQVRMAASVLCRAFWTAQLRLEADCGDLLPVLLPRMCLNRFYLAQGVKLYSHETWKLCWGDTGVDRVVTYLSAVVRYYVKQCDADNHAVREAACQAIAELAVRLGTDETYRDDLQRHVPVLLQALVMCFYDESWPVRDEACSATGQLCRSFPDECRDELKTLWERWTEQLTDPIWSCREDAAVALGDAVEAYGIDFLNDRVLPLLRDKLIPAAKLQPAMTAAEYKARQNDAAAHTGSQLYSCGSLAPKLSKKAGAGRIGAGRAGCTSCAVDRPKAPWEATDGGIYLTREIVVRCCCSQDPTENWMTDDALVELFSELIEACRVRHFPQSDDLRATLWKQLPAMAHAIGKNRFKRTYLHMFLDPLMSHLERKTTSSALSRHAAAQCAQELADLVGRAIFRGRLDDYQREAFDAALLERESLPPGPAEPSASPFGPPGLLDAVWADKINAAAAAAAATGRPTALGAGPASTTPGVGGGGLHQPSSELGVGAPTAAFPAAATGLGGSQQW